MHYVCRFCCWRRESATTEISLANGLTCLALFFPPLSKFGVTSLTIRKSVQFAAARAFKSMNCFLIGPTLRFTTPTKISYDSILRVSKSLFTLQRAVPLNFKYFCLLGLRPSTESRQIFTRRANHTFHSSEVVFLGIRSSQSTKTVTTFDFPHLSADSIVREERLSKDVEELLVYATFGCFCARDKSEW